MLVPLRRALCALSLFTPIACGGTAVSTPPLGPVVVLHDQAPLALKPLSLKFAVIGDSGQWSTAASDARAVLTEHQVDVVFSGHEHVYERMALLIKRKSSS